MACTLMPGAEHLTGLYNPWTYPYDTPSYPESQPHAHSQPQSQAQSESRAQSQVQPQSQSPEQSNSSSSGSGSSSGSSSSSKGTGRHRGRRSSYDHLSEVLRSYLPSLAPSRKLPGASGRGLERCRNPAWSSGELSMLWTWEGMGGLRRVT